MESSLSSSLCPPLALLAPCHFLVDSHLVASGQRAQGRFGVGDGVQSPLPSWEPLCRGHGWLRCPHVPPPLLTRHPPLGLPHLPWAGWGRGRGHSWGQKGCTPLPTPDGLGSPSHHSASGALGESWAGLGWAGPWPGGRAAEQAKLERNAAARCPLGGAWCDHPLPSWAGRAPPSPDWVKRAPTEEGGAAGERGPLG